MYLSGESILIILFVGLVAGWLAGKIVQGTGFGLIGDIAIGIVGAFIASWLLPRLGIGLGVGLVRAIIDAKIAGKEIVAPAVETPARVVNLMEALKKSLDTVSRAKKTPAKASIAKPAAKRRRAG